LIKGVCFHSDTDTEVLINLIEEVQKKENIKLGKAVQIALNQVVGLMLLLYSIKKIK
jgi:glucosamine--fructose-6-phosphate aminotransferase (isomerizing)